MIFDENSLRDLIKSCVREVLDERAAVIDGNTLSKEQVAKMLSITTRTVTTYMQREGLPHSKRGGRAEFNRDEVLTWWRERGKTVRLKAV